VTPDLASLSALLPDGSVSTEPADLAAHAHDWWTLALLKERRGDAVAQPVAVVRPASTDEVAAVLRWAQETRTPVVPFGGGSGVSGGVEAIEGSIAIDTRQLTEVLSLDETALTVTAQAGIGGAVLEEWLAERGYTLGHFPQSIEISTLGGWIAARSAGQKSARYGRLEDMVLGLEVVLPEPTTVGSSLRDGTSHGFPCIGGLVLVWRGRSSRRSFRRR
jgi:alkyldihydroxyacetonephosphate synthase